MKEIWKKMWVGVFILNTVYKKQYYFNLFQSELDQAENFLIAPRMGYFKL